MDSTNAMKRGFSPSERLIVPHLEDEIREAEGRVFLTTFSSHMPRIKNLKRIARRTGRHIAFLGRGFLRHFAISRDTGYMDPWPDVFVSLEEGLNLADHQLIIVLTGSQAEMQSALMRVIREGFKGVKIRAGDRVIFSSKAIPGNERAIALMAADLERQGAEVVNEKTRRVHTSGHGFREDLNYMLTLLRPRSVAPIHGEYTHLLAHHHWLQSLIDEDQQTLMVEDGDVLEIIDGETRLRASVSTGMLPIDGARNLPIEHVVLRDRKDMMYSGLVLVNVRKARKGHSFEVSTNGMVEDDPGEMADRLEKILMQSPPPGTSRSEWADHVYFTLKKAIKKMFGLRPVIKVVVDGHILK
jgi:ribonuclease J